MERLVITFHPSHSLEQCCLRDIWSIYSLHHNVRLDEFLSRTRGQFTSMALYRCRRQGSIVGFTGLRRDFIFLHNGSRILTVYFGQTYVLDNYRGRQLLPWTGALFLLKHRLRYPLMPVYIWFDAISYKSYMILARHVKEFFPRRSARTPEVVREIIDQLGSRHYPRQYDQSTGRVIKASNRLKEHVAPLTPNDLDEPNIAFYVKRNPGYLKGDGLLCILPGNLANLLHFMGRAFLRQLNTTRKTG